MSGSGKPSAYFVAKRRVALGTMSTNESSGPQSLRKLQSRCASDLTQWLANSEDFRAEYEELRSLGRHLPWNPRLPEFEEDNPSPELIDLVERVFLEMIEQAPSRLQPASFGAWARPDWESELIGELRREYLGIEGDRYGPE